MKILENSNTEQYKLVRSQPTENNDLLIIILFYLIDQWNATTNKGKTALKNSGSVLCIYLNKCSNVNSCELLWLRTACPLFVR